MYVRESFMQRVLKRGMDNESLFVHYNIIRRESPLRLILVLTTSSVVQTEFSTIPSFMNETNCRYISS